MGSQTGRDSTQPAGRACQIRPCFEPTTAAWGLQDGMKTATPGSRTARTDTPSAEELSLYENLCLLGLAGSSSAPPTFEINVYTFRKPNQACIDHVLYSLCSAIKGKSKAQKVGHCAIFSVLKQLSRLKLGMHASRTSKTCGP